MEEFIKEFESQYNEKIKIIDDENYTSLLNKNLPLALQMIRRKLDKESVLTTLYFAIYNEIGDELFNKVELNNEIKQLLSYVKDINNINLTNLETEAENLRSMFIAMAKDIRVIFIKLYDILFQAQHFSGKNDLFFKSIEDVYIPLAARLGLSYIKSSLQDLCLQYFHPKEFEKLQNEVGIFNNVRNEQIEVMKSELKELLNQLEINGEIFGRVKHISSIYNKLQNKHTTLKQIYDLSAVRILVQSVGECYAVLGAVHTKYTPIDGRFKDYIASPKENGYQSLHTTVIMQNGEPIEIQIRTYKMHEHAEYGVAAHFLYKEHKSKKQSLDDKLLWIRQLIENSSDLSAEDLIDELKTDLYLNEIYVQTPKGKIIKLIEGATPIDFAYQIHSDIGNKCVGAKVNGKMMPLATALNNGDVVEIITNPNSKGPSRDWLKIVKGVSTKSKINAFYKKEMKEENIKKGKLTLETTAKNKGIQLSKLLEEEFLSEVTKRYAFSTFDELCASVGYGAVTGTQIINKLIACFKIKYIDELQDNTEIEPETIEKHKNNNEIVVKGVNNLLLRFAHCCNPIPGDEIVGFFSRGRGVTIHRKDCPNLTDFDKDRLASATWGETPNENFPISLNVKVNNLSKSINDITSKLNNLKITLQGLSTKSSKNNNIINLTIVLNKQTSLTDIINKISAIPNVIEITRAKR